MTLPLDIVLDLHQDGLRVRLSTYAEGDDAGELEVQITGPLAERVHIPIRQLPQLRLWLAQVADLAEQREGDVRARGVVRGGSDAIPRYLPPPFEFD